MKEDDASRDWIGVYRHVIGTPTNADPLIYEEKDVQFSITLNRTRDKKFFVCSSESSTTSEQRVIPGRSCRPAAVGDRAEEGRSGILPSIIAATASTSA